VNDTIYTSYNSAEALKKALLGIATVVTFPATNPLEPVHAPVHNAFVVEVSILVPVNAPAAVPFASDGVNVPDVAVVDVVGNVLIVTGKSQIFPNAAVVE
jgi:hypothetical protein